MADDQRINPAVARYKAYLQKLIGTRPSGLRGRLARALGKHKSFVSQITSPNYPAPIPSVHVDTIIRHCQLTETEAMTFLALYREAHGEAVSRNRISNCRTLTIDLPAFEFECTGREVESMILSFAHHTIRLAQRTEHAHHDNADKGGSR